MMLNFVGSKAYGNKRTLKLIVREINIMAPLVLIYLKWSERAITFDKNNHHSHVLEAGHFPL